MKYLHISNDQHDAQAVRDKLENTCFRLEREGYRIVNCQYINQYHIIVFYTK